MVLGGLHFSHFPLAALLRKDRKGNGWVKNWNDIARTDFYKKARLPPEALKTVLPSGKQSVSNYSFPDAEGRTPLA